MNISAVALNARLLTHFRPVVAPVSVIQNWEKQISEHVVPGKLSYYVYYGRARQGVSANDLQKHDIVITTYHSISREHQKSLEVGGTKAVESLLLRFAWKASIISSSCPDLRSPPNYFPSGSS